MNRIRIKLFRSIVTVGLLFGKSKEELFWKFKRLLPGVFRVYHPRRKV